MHKSFFDKQVEILRETYGHRSYPEARVDRFWDRYGKIDGEEFKRAVDNLINSSRYAPLGTDFDTELHSALARVREQYISDLVKNYPCQICKSTGRVSHKFDDYPTAFSFRCTCKIGRELFLNFPIYNQQNMVAAKKMIPENHTKAKSSRARGNVDLTEWENLDA